MTPSTFILSFVLITASLLLGVKLLSLLLVRRQRKRNIPVNEYLNGRYELGPADLCFPVRYASAELFRNFISLLPWEAEGVLVLNDSQFIYLGRNSSGEEQLHYFDRNNCLVLYEEPNKLRDGGLSWFSLEAEDGSKHYFCTQTKIPDLSTDFGTTALYEKITERYSNL